MDILSPEADFKSGYTLHHATGHGVFIYLLKQRANEKKTKALAQHCHQIKYYI